jgi:hypothetical protein
VADPHGEQLHDLASEVFVGRSLDVHPGVEKGQHRRILGHADEQIAEVAGRVPLEQLELPQHLAVVAHLVLARGEVAMPEQRHLLLERPASPQHPLGPPVPDPVRLQAARTQPVEELIGHCLQAPVAARLDAHAERLAGRLGEIGHGGTAGGERLQARIVHAGMLEGPEVAVVDRLVGHERRDRRLGRHPGQPLDLVGGGAERGALEQVGRAILAPVGRRDRRQVVDPAGRPCPPAVRHGSLLPFHVHRRPADVNRDLTLNR